MYINPMKCSAWMLAQDTMVHVIMSSIIVATKLSFNLQILQAADERREAELHQKDEEIRQKNTQLEVHVTLGMYAWGNRSSTL
ncbi:MAG: hypothetical protein MJE68_04980 [Proteobacteria bacterium]|nr:hypothetical protein [Pseudomonadota bacterium]